MIGQVLSHYQLRKHLARGGMGDLYLAEDLRLGREVAVKVLAESQAHDAEARARFVHEAKAQAMLTHPNIVTFLDAGEAGEHAFIVMEYIDGSTLADYIKSHELRMDDAIDIAVQIGEGLEAAHAAGVIHRDIKPENIMVTRTGQVKITDFGLARWKGATTITKTGTLMGTAHYMSPEQAEGRRLDRRTDVFSLGVVLYELLCLRRPFEGDSDATVLFEVAFGTPQPLSRYCSGATAGLERIVEKALAKRPDERYQSAADLVADLRNERRLIDSGATGGSGPWRRRREKRLSWWVAGGFLAIVLIVAIVLRLPRALRWPSSAGIERLAVLPFENLGPPEREYFAAGMTDEITSRLARATNLQVISRTSANRFKDTNKSLREIADELDVDYVLEGTIRWEQTEATNRVRIIPQLIRTSDDSHIWSNEYEQGMDYVLTAQVEIAESVARAMGAILSGSRSGETDKPGTEDPEAYDLYLRGSEYFNRGFRQEDLRIAADLFRHAVARDPNFPEAHARLSRVSSRTHWYWARGNANDTNIAVASRECEAALRITPALPEGHIARGFYRYWCEANLDGALESFALARALSPNNADVQFATAGVLRRMGLFDSATVLLRLAASLDPLSWEKAFEIGNTLYRTRDFAGADSAFARAITLSPDQPVTYARRALNAVNRDGDTHGARAILASASTRTDTTSLVPVAITLDILDGEYESALGRLRARPNNEPYHYLKTADVLRYLGRADESRAYSDSARSVTEAELSESADDPVILANLGLAMAGLGAKDSAIALGMRAVHMGSVTKDAFGGPLVLEVFAQICLLSGEYDRAVDLLQVLLDAPSQVAARLISIDPDWLPVRESERFRAMIRTHMKPEE